MKKFVFFISIIFLPTITSSAASKALTKNASKQSDAIFELLFKIVDDIPLIPSRDIKLSFKLTKSLKKLTGTERPTLMQLRESLELLPRSVTQERTLAILYLDNTDIPSTPQLYDALNGVLYLADNPQFARSDAVDEFARWALPISIQFPLEPLNITGTEYTPLFMTARPILGEEFSALWNGADQKVRHAFLESYLKKNKLQINSSIIQNYAKKDILDLKSADRRIEKEMLEGAFNTNDIFNDYLIRTYIFGSKSSQKILSLYSEIAAKEWANLTPKQLRTVEKIYGLDSNASYWERQKSYVDLVSKTIEQMKSEVRDAIIKNYDLWSFNSSPYTEELQKEAVQIAKKKGAIPAAMELGISPTLIDQWAKSFGISLKAIP